MQDETEPDKSSPIGLDFSHWPLIITTPPPRPVTNEELHDFLDRFEDGLRAREGRYVSVLDLRWHTGITPRQRRMLTERMNAAHEGVAKDRLTGTAMIFTSALLRSLLTAIFWLRKSDHPTVVLRNLDDALAWGKRTLANQEAGEDVRRNAQGS